MKTYRKHIDFFSSEIQALGAAPFNVSFSSMLEALAHDGLLETDKACRIFAETLVGPPYLIEFDLNYACALNVPAGIACK